MHEILAPSVWMAELPQISMWIGFFLSYLGSYSYFFFFSFPLISVLQGTAQGREKSEQIPRNLNCHPVIVL